MQHGSFQVYDLAFVLKTTSLQRFIVVWLLAFTFCFLSLPSAIGCFRLAATSTTTNEDHPHSPSGNTNSHHDFNLLSDTFLSCRHLRLFFSDLRCLLKSNRSLSSRPLLPPSQPTISVTASSMRSLPVHSYWMKPAWFVDQPVVPAFLRRFLQEIMHQSPAEESSAESPGSYLGRA